MSDIALGELNHLWDGLRREDGQEVGDEKEPVFLALGCPSRLDSAQSDSLALVRAPSSAVNQRGVEAVHIKVLIIDEETLAHGRVAVLVGLDVKFDLVVQELALVGCNHVSLIGEDG